MSNPLPTDGVQLVDGDTVILLCGDYNPAHIGYFRALESLVMKQSKEVWLAPLSSRMSNEHVGSMCTIMATEVTSATKKQVGCCLVGVSKGFDSSDQLSTWCRKYYPGLKFKIARLAGYAETRTDIEIGFAGQNLSTLLSFEQICLSKFLPPPSNLVERIRSGADESRNFLTPIWEYVQRHRLYRNDHGKS